VTDDVRYLEYIDRSIGHVQEYVAGGREAFLASRLVQDAVLDRLHTIAEVIQRDLPLLETAVQQMLRDGGMEPDAREGASSDR
jgi:hypothetical protein